MPSSRAPNEKKDSLLIIRARYHTLQLPKEFEQVNSCMRKISPNTKQTTFT